MLHQILIPIAILSAVVVVMSASEKSSLTELNVFRGALITLNCSLKGNVSTETFSGAEWFKGDKPIASHECPTGEECKHQSSIPKRIHVEVDYSNRCVQLVIKDVQDSDKGTYVCDVTTIHGINQKHFSLSVDASEASIVINSSSIAGESNPSRLVVLAETEVELTCSGSVERGNYVAINWMSQELHLQVVKNSTRTDGNGKALPRTSTVRFRPGVSHNGTTIECVVDYGHRNITKKVVLDVQALNISYDATERTVVVDDHSPGSPSRTCLRLNVFSENHFRQSQTCHGVNEVIHLPQNVDDGYVVVVSCSEDNVCTNLMTIKKNHSVDDSFTIATILAISLYVIVGIGIIAIVALLIRRRKVQALRRLQEEHIYTEPPMSISSTLPPPPRIWIEYERSNSFETSYGPQSSVDEELQELSFCWSDESTIDRQSMTSKLSSLKRQGLRNSELIYGNIPFRNMLDRVKAAGWSYF